MTDHKAPETDSGATTAEQKATIEAAARKQLRQSSYPPVRNVACRYDSGVLVLEGRIPSYYLKQVAQARILHRLEGIVEIDNRLVVEPASKR